jgi:hypothetical protein
MILTGSALLLVFLFSVLAGIHFYWSLGGRWAIEVVVPVNKEGKKVINASALSSLLVGLGLLMFAMYYLNCIVEWITLPIMIQQSVGLLIPIIFLLRAIGDFNYVGYSKKIKDTEFARRDTKYFAPLCVVIALLGSIVDAV